MFGRPNLSRLLNKLYERAFMEKRRINVRAIVWRDGKILAVKHKDDDGSESEHWAVSGGGLDPLESLEDGVKREIMEELGLEIEVGKLLMVQQFNSKRDDFDEELEFLFQVEDSPMFDTIDLEKTTHGMEELARVAFVDPKEVFIKPTFLSELDIDALIKAPITTHVSNDL